MDPGVGLQQISDIFRQSKFLLEMVVEGRNSSSIHSFFIFQWAVGTTKPRGQFSGFVIQPNLVVMS